MPLDLLVVLNKVSKRGHGRASLRTSGVTVFVLRFVKVLSRVQLVAQRASGGERTEHCSLAETFDTAARTTSYIHREIVSSM